MKKTAVGAVALAFCWMTVSFAEETAAPQNDVLRAAEKAVRQYAEKAAPPDPAAAPERQSIAAENEEDSETVTTVPAAQRDNILQAIDQAARQYQADDLAGAVSNLDYASQLIRQKKSERMKALLPEALPGWLAKTATAQTLGVAVFGGGTTVSRDYFTASGTAVSVEIVSDSPVLQSIIMMLDNPLFAVGSLQTVKGQRAMIRYDEKERSGEINVVVAGRFIVTVKGRQIDQAGLLRYAEAVDFEAVAKN
jgi:hypothetical protein